MQLVALQCSMEMQARFMAEMSLFDPQMYVWVDETASNRRMQPKGDESSFPPTTCWREMDQCYWSNEYARNGRCLHCRGEC